VTGSSSVCQSGCKLELSAVENRQRQVSSQKIKSLTVMLCCIHSWNLLQCCWLGDGKGIPPVKRSCFSNPQRFSFEGPSLIWSNLWKNRPVKQKPELVVELS